MQQLGSKEEADLVDACSLPVSPARPFLGSPAGAAWGSGGCDGGRGHQRVPRCPQPHLLCCVQGCSALELTGMERGEERSSSAAASSPGERSRGQFEGAI